MNIRFALLTVGLFCLAMTPAFCDETNFLHRPQDMPTNELAVFDDFHQSVDGEDLAEALGIMHWNFQVQVPDGTDMLSVNLHLVETNSDSVLGKLNLSTRKMDALTGKDIPGVKQFRVLVVISPLDTSVNDPLFESVKLRVFEKNFLTHSSSRIIIENPFYKKSKDGFITTHGLLLSRDHKVPWDTRFDLMSSANDKRILRISFGEAR